MANTEPFLTLDIEAATAAWIAASPESPWAQLIDYWRRLAARLRRMPARGDIDPLEIGGQLLGNLFLVDIEPGAGEGKRYRFRLIGERILARETVRPGDYLADIAHTPDIDGIERHYADARAGRIRLRETTLKWESPDKDHVHYRSVVLPLAASDDPGRIGHLIGCAVYDDEKWFG